MQQPLPTAAQANEQDQPALPHRMRHLSAIDDTRGSPWRRVCVIQRIRKAFEPRACREKKRADSLTSQGVWIHIATLRSRMWHTEIRRGTLVVAPCFLTWHGSSANLRALHELCEEHLGVEGQNDVMRCRCSAISCAKRTIQSFASGYVVFVYADSYSDGDARFGTTTQRHTIRGQHQMRT